MTSVFWWSATNSFLCFFQPDCCCSPARVVFSFTVYHCVVLWQTLSHIATQSCPGRFHQLQAPSQSPESSHHQPCNTWQHTVCCCWVQAQTAQLCIFLRGRCCNYLFLDTTLGIEKNSYLRGTLKSPICRIIQNRHIWVFAVMLWYWPNYAFGFVWWYVHGLLGEYLFAKQMKMWIVGNIYCTHVSIMLLLVKYGNGLRLKFTKNFCIKFKPHKLLGLHSSNLKFLYLW